jgi:hypothetical protein
MASSRRVTTCSASTTVSLGLEIYENAMAQDRTRNRANIVERHRRSPL